MELEKKLESIVEEASKLGLTADEVSQKFTEVLKSVYGNVVVVKQSNNVNIAIGEQNKDEKKAEIIAEDTYNKLKHMCSQKDKAEKLTIASFVLVLVSYILLNLKIDKTGLLAIAGTIAFLVFGTRLSVLNKNIKQTVEEGWERVYSLAPHRKDLLNKIKIC